MTKPKIMVVPVTPFQQNCSIVWDEDTQAGAVVDPGGDVDTIMQAIAKSGAKIERIILTHGHIDHAGGAAELKERLGIPIDGPHTEDLFLLQALDWSGAQYGLEGAQPVTPDRWLEEGDEVKVGGLVFQVLHCPGHTPGSVVLFNREHRFCFMGDVLFKGSVGRSDFPYGNHETLIRSIKQKIIPLGDDVSFLPGHGAASTVGEERRSNPFLT
jgi:hydroxyacylglutathione hydrolase